MRSLFIGLIIFVAFGVPAFAGEPDSDIEKQILVLTHWANTDCKDEVCRASAKQYIDEVRTYAERVSKFVQHKTKAEQTVLLKDGYELADRIDNLAANYRLPAHPEQEKKEVRK